MRRMLLAAGLLLFAADLSYGQTCQAFVNGAKARMSKNKFAEAREVLAAELPNCGDHAEFHYLYAVSLVRVSPDSAGKAVNLLTIADSLNGEPTQGDDAELENNIEQAILALWGPLVNEGVRLVQAGRFDEAQPKLELAVEMNPQGKEGHLALGAVFQEKNEFDRAIEHYRRAMEIDPAYKQALLRLGVAYQLKADAFASSGDSTQVAQATATAQQAVDVYQAYLAQNPNDFDVQVQLAGLYASLGQLDRAEPIIRQVMEADSVDAQVLTDFGFRLANAQQFDLAEDLLERAIVLTDSTNVEPLSYLVFVRIQKGDLQGARAIVKKQLELEPSNAESWEYLGYIERDLGDTAAAQEAFARGQAIPLELQSLRFGQGQDRKWNVEATFSNRTDAPVQNVKVKFSLLSATGDVLETKDVEVGDSGALAAGQAESVSVVFDGQATNPRVRYEIES